MPAESLEKEELSERQLACLSAIENFHAKNGYAPTLIELSQLLGVSTSAVDGYLTGLQRKGYINRSNGVSRSIVITKKE